MFQFDVIVLLFLPNFGHPFPTFRQHLWRCPLLSPEILFVDNCFIEIEYRSFIFTFNFISIFYGCLCYPDNNILGGGIMSVLSFEWEKSVPL